MTTPNENGDAPKSEEIESNATNTSATTTNADGTKPDLSAMETAVIEMLKNTNLQAGKSQGQQLKMVQQMVGGAEEEGETKHAFWDTQVRCAVFLCNVAYVPGYRILNTDRKTTCKAIDRLVQVSHFSFFRFRQ
jgi:hypothetical protein